MFGSIIGVGKNILNISVGYLGERCFGACGIWVKDCKKESKADFHITYLQLKKAWGIQSPGLFIKLPLTLE
ncbi:hypothetical protein [Microbulbifer sp. GL-2]|uniref:hypothetical protein n=1 Tax=Microbulbifer sp. GL-2 TaxID=2591606 RepID=UPI00117C8B57|nr:hypothetical protein [Microbulbifer sp. GL-2]